MPRCRQCGNRLMRDDTFCTMCGASVNAGHNHTHVSSTANPISTSRLGGTERNAGDLPAPVQQRRIRMILVTVIMLCILIVLASAITVIRESHMEQSWSSAPDYSLYGSADR